MWGATTGIRFPVNYTFDPLFPRPNRPREEGKRMRLPGILFLKFAGCPGQPPRRPRFDRFAESAYTGSNRSVRFLSGGADAGGIALPNGLSSPLGPERLGEGRSRGNYFHDLFIRQLFSTAQDSKRADRGRLPLHVETRQRGRTTNGTQPTG